MGENKYEKKSLEDAIIALEDEVMNMKSKRDDSYSDKVKESLNNQILSFILCIQHLKDLIGDEKDW